MHPHQDALKVAILLAVTIALSTVFVFAGIEGILSQIGRDVTSAIVFYLVTAVSFIGVLWAYTRAKQLIRAMPADDY